MSRGAAIIVAGGTGERFGAPGGKQLAMVLGSPVVTHSMRAFEKSSRIHDIILVTHPERVDEYREAAVRGPDVTKVVAVVGGGQSRQDSVAAGVAALDSDVAYVAVHDGARPLVRPATIDAAIAALTDDQDLGGVVVGHPVADTIQALGADGTIEDTPDREALWVAQTPQVFRADVLRRALEAAAAQGIAATDDGGLVARMGERVRMVEGPRDNIKVTVPEDLAYVEWVLARRAEEG